MMIKIDWRSLFLVLAVLWTAPAVLAVDSGITVDGMGRVEVKPDTVEVEGTLSGEAELGADAVVKFRDTKRRIGEALAKLEIDNLKVEWGGIGVGPGVADSQAAQQAAMRGQLPPTEISHVAVKDSAKLVLSQLEGMKEEAILETLVKLIDAGKDAGLSMPPTGQQMLVQFRLTNTKESETKAYELAMKNAVDRAERLAALAGVKLGSVESVEVTSEFGVEKPSAMSPYMNVYAYRAATQAKKLGRLESFQMKPIPVEVRLRVRFRITGNKPKVGGAEG